MFTNRLATATSPYLLQHATQPVAWWPWCAEALQLARSSDRPILLSIGYSACHWCHVMAHESFEDAETAAVMNALFVNIKVDREERPDLDKIYQTAHRILTQRPGGWPLTVFLTPENLMPFFAGTYFPPQPHAGFPGFRELLHMLARAYRERRAEIATQRIALQEAFAALTPQAQHTLPDEMPLMQARRQLALQFDAEHGGFGAAPKFPRPTELEFLLSQYAISRSRGAPDHGALHMVAFTLEQMIRGGIHDQLGGGFHRYAVDARWEIPHFEKMLYDNAQLLVLCCDLWQLTGQDIFRTAAQTTAAWIRREMQTPAGGYCASLDADSDGGEGRFYLWTAETVRAALSAAEYALLAPLYGLDGPPNFAGYWHLHEHRPLAELAAAQGLTVAEAQQRLAQAKARLFTLREQRVRPGRDDKILTAWNALAIKGMARAARVLGEDAALRSAEAALAYIRRDLWRDGQLRATTGAQQCGGYLDDYAFLLDALLELLQTRWRGDDLTLAIALAEALLERFEDSEHGGFFFTAAGSETLPYRPKPLGDEALPAGNGSAALALQRLGCLLGEPRYLAAAERVLKFAAEPLQHWPAAHATLLMALREALEPSGVLILRAPAAELAAWQAVATAAYAPHRVTVAIPAAAEDVPAVLAPFTADTGPRAYFCRGRHCVAPLENLAALRAALG